MSKKQFIAVTTKTLDNKLVYLTTSAGDTLFNVNGVHYTDAIDFLFSLSNKRKRSKGVVFVCYAFQRDNEFIFSTMPKELKDKLFESHKIKKAKTELEVEIDKLEDDYWRFDRDTQEFALTDFELYVNRTALAELNEVRVDKYLLDLANGKFLNIRKEKKSITIYDVYSFFRPRTLQRSIKDFLGLDVKYLHHNNFDFLDLAKGCIDLDKLKSHANLEADLVSRLVTELNNRLVCNGIKLKSFYGTGAIASHLLSKSKARKQYNSYSKKRQLPVEMSTSLRRATFGGRIEQIRIGTVENVRVYDINSAYPYAIKNLPIMLQKPFYVKDWQDIDFSFWQCDFDFTKAGLHIGLLPYRDIGGRTRFPLKGRGVYWNPEIKFILEHYPQCIEIDHGYIHIGERLEVCNLIDHFYNLRLKLKERNDPIGDVIKVGLSSISGKFFQQNGKGYYYNLFYAGYITSQTRAQILQAVKGFDRDIICFQTDAIHSAIDLNVPLSNQLGDFKKSEYEKVVYLDNGVYQCYQNGIPVKTKTQGFRLFDFAKCFKELSETKSYTALSEFFVGHNLFTRHLFTGASYLSDFGAEKTMSPASKDKIAMRYFEERNVDLTKEYLDSFPVVEFNGLLSAPYNPMNTNRTTDICSDTIFAGRI